MDTFKIGDWVVMEFPDDLPQANPLKGVIGEVTDAEYNGVFGPFCIVLGWRMSHMWLRRATDAEILAAKLGVYRVDATEP